MKYQSFEEWLKQQSSFSGSFQELQEIVRKYDEQRRVRADLVRVRERSIRETEVKKGNKIFPIVTRNDRYNVVLACHTKVENDVLSMYRYLGKGVNNLFSIWENQRKPIDKVSNLVEVILPEARNDIKPIITDARRVLRNIAKIVLSYEPGKELPAANEDDLTVARMEKEISKFYNGIDFSFRHYYSKIFKALSVIAEQCEINKERTIVYPLIYTYQDFRRQLPERIKVLRSLRVETLFKDFID